MVYPRINILSEIKDRNARKDTPVLVDTLSAWADFPMAPTQLSIWEFQTSFLRGCRHTAHHTVFRADDVRITQFTLNSAVAFLHTKISECIYNSVLFWGPWTEWCPGSSLFQWKLNGHYFVILLNSDKEVERNAKPTKMEREQRPQPLRVFDLCG